jgi:hypothetical protein
MLRACTRAAHNDTRSLPEVLLPVAEAAAASDVALTLHPLNSSELRATTNTRSCPASALIHT